VTALACAGCGRAVADDAPWPFTCPDAGDGRDHVVARAAAPAWPVLDGAPAGNPFVRYRALTYPWQLARARGLGDDGYLALVAELDRAVARVDGRGFAITPYRSVTDAGGRAIHAKDETGHVAGSHKARHLFGLALWLTVAERTGLVGAPDRRRPLAIASCGNAALAAAGGGPRPRLAAHGVRAAVG
jgi:threonine synthase